jgi:hypothetical protein
MGAMRVCILMLLDRHDTRVFYDVTETEAEVLAIVPKAQAEAWLKEKGAPSSPGSPGKGKG